MTPEEQRVAVAKALGWNTTKEQLGGVFIYRDKEGRMHGDLPNYTKDLNAIQSAILTLSSIRTLNKNGQQWSERDEFLQQLEAIVIRDSGITDNQIMWPMVTASAGQLTEAFVRTRKLWKEA